MLCIIASILLLLTVTSAQTTPPSRGTPPPFQLADGYCGDKCYQREMYCPLNCKFGCKIDCNTCQPICLPYVDPLNPDFYNLPPPPAPPVPSPPPPPPEQPYSRARCTNNRYPECYRMEHICPMFCPYNCMVDCVTCSPVCNCFNPGAVCEDPKFVGGDGITFYFHGKKDRNFCIVSDSNLHINAHFIGKRNENMTRDFTWVQSLGILFDDHKLHIGAKKTSVWNNQIDRLFVTFDSQFIALPDGEGMKWEQPTIPGRVISITRTRYTNAVTIEVPGNFQIKATVVPISEHESRVHNYGITKEDCFAHLDLSFKFYSLSGSVNGVLGQTYADNYVSKVKMGIEMPVLGGEKKFASSNIFSTDCAAARFNGTNSNASKNFEFANLKCGSEISGRVVVCKR